MFSFCLGILISTLVICSSLGVNDFFDTAKTRATFSVFENESSCWANIDNHADLMMVHVGSSLSSTPCLSSSFVDSLSFRYKLVCFEQGGGGWELNYFEDDQNCFGTNAKEKKIVGSHKECQSAVINGHSTFVLVNCDFHDDLQHYQHQRQLQSSTDTTSGSGNDDGGGSSDFVFAWLVYLAYFAGVCIVAALVDISTLPDKRVKALGDSAFESFKQYSMLKVDKDLEAKGASESERSHSVDSIANSGERARNESCEKVMKYCCCIFPDESYSDAFFTNILKGKCYFGCEGVVYSEGVALYHGFRLPVGFMEDLMFYLCNNHKIGSMMFAARGNPFSRSGRRIAFFGQNCFALFTQTLINYLTADNLDPTTIALINVFVIAPLSNLVNNFFHFMLVCPCMSAYMHHKNVGCCAKLVKCIGMTIAYPAALGGIAFLLIAAVLVQYNSSQTAEAASAQTIAKYAWSVHIVASVYDILGCFKMFLTGSGTTSLKICGFTALEYGDWFKQKMLDNMKEPTTDYVLKESTCCCCIKVEVLLDSEFAEKLKETSAEMTETVNRIHNSDL